MVDAAPNAAVVHEPVAVEKTQSVTLEPVKDTSFAPAAGAAVVSIDAARDAACQAALAGLKADLMQWKTEGFLRHCLLWQEYGKLKAKAHLQTSFTTLTLEREDAAACRELDRRLRPLLAAYTAGGMVKWTFRKHHVHTDPKLLDGYCAKQHLRYASWDVCPYLSIGDLYTRAYLIDAYQHWLSSGASGSESGPSTLSVDMPGQEGHCPVMTRASLLTDVEYWEHQEGFTELNLQRAKAAGMRVAQKQAKLHAHFASSTSGEPSALVHSLWARVRKQPKLAENVSIMNKLIYGPSSRAAARSVAARSSHPSEMSGSSMRTAEPSSEKLESTDRRAVAISPSAPREGKSAMLACDAT